MYPVKSMSGWELPTATVVDTGFAHDREWMVVDEQHNFVSQRQYPKMAIIRPTLRDDILTLDVNGRKPVHIPISENGKRITTDVWTSPCETIDQGHDAAAWLSDYLGKPCRLVRMAPTFRRQLRPKYQVSGTEVVCFADRLPFLLATEASLNNLNDKLPEPVAMSRFRPNIVLTNTGAFAEDTWSRIKIGQVWFRVEKACDRCEVITVNQETGEKGLEPLETLGTYRTQPKGIMFGQVMIQENHGTIKIGDVVEVIA